MKRFLAVLVFAIGISGSGWAQSADLVAIFSDSARQEVAWLRETAEHVERVSTSVDQLIRLNQMVTYQAQAIETMSQGGWDNFVEGYQYQAMAMGTMSDVLLNVGDGAIGQLAGLDEAASSEGFMDFAQSADSLATVADAQATLLQQTDQAIMATQANAQMMQQAVAGGKGSKSPVEKLQRNNMVLQGVGNQLGIVSSQLGATARAEEVRLYEQKIRDNATEEYIEGWYAENVQYDNKYSEDLINGYLDGTSAIDKLNRTGSRMYP